MDEQFKEFKDVYDILVRTIDGVEKQLQDYSGKVLLVVNVASYCVNTPQYSELEQLYQKYKPEGVEILAFPCNDFGGQEPGNMEEILELSRGTYGVTFELFDKIHAIGKEQHPLYMRLTKTVEPIGDLTGNFEKFLVNRQGKPVARFHYSIKPDDSKLIAAIEQEILN